VDDPLQAPPAGRDANSFAQQVCWVFISKESKDLSLLQGEGSFLCRKFCFIHQPDLENPEPELPPPPDERPPLDDENDPPPAEPPDDEFRIREDETAAAAAAARRRRIVSSSARILCSMERALASDEWIWLIAALALALDPV